MSLPERAGNLLQAERRMMTIGKRRVGAPSLTIVLAALAMPLSACGQVSPGDQEVDEPIAALESITEAAIRAHLTVLAHDDLLGRDTPSAGLDTAAEYLADQHEGNGLVPGGDGGSFYQRYPYALMGPDPAGALITFVGPETTVRVETGRDAFIEGGRDGLLEAPLSFVSAEAAGPTQSESLEGQVAVFRLPGEWGQTLWFRSLEQAAMARSSGALGVIHLLDAAFPITMIDQLTEALAEPTWQLGGDAFLPRVFVREGTIRSAFGQGAPPWERSESGGGGTAPLPTGVALQATLPVTVVEGGAPPNVLAVLPGSDPTLRDEYVVLTAHFDHVGMGRPVAGDSIYNGADDNGSGTSVLLEVARTLQALPEAARPRRSVLFLHVSGEEKGLLGSEWWVTHPTVPLDAVVANVNVDMVGGDAHPDTVAVLGKDYSTLGPLIDSVNDRHPELSLVTAPDLWPEEGLFFRSDQLNFMTEEIPALFLFAGFHDCYHLPCDEMDFVDADKVARVARLVAYTVLEITNGSPRPQWNESGLTEMRRMVSGR